MPHFTMVIVRGEIVCWGGAGTHSPTILPYAFAFAAGSMIFVVVEELVPESQTGGHLHSATWGAIIGFAVMMTLDVALG